ncbi:MAG: Crp/Fnr family transcriptional regulator [Bacillota bacterium]
MQQKKQKINLNDIHLFKNLRKDNLEKIKDKSQLKKYQKNKVLFLVGDKSDTFFIVLEGRVKIIRSSSKGREKILKKMNSGDFFGEMGIIEDKSRSATAIVEEESTLLLISKNNFLNLLNNSSQLALNLIVDLSKRLRKADKDIEDLAFFSVEMRLKRFFRENGKRLNDKKEYYYLDKDYTHQELANFLGSSRETITRIFNKLEAKGIVEYKDEKIILKYSE